MALVVAAQRLPLVTDADGVVRVGSTRVTLDTVVAAFRDGLTAEEIVAQYPALRLADVYQVIGYFLDHEAEVDCKCGSSTPLKSAVRTKTVSIPWVSGTASWPAVSKDEQPCWR
jgi:uncharacterized protein (DUF433 family)